MNRPSMLCIGMLRITWQEDRIMSRYIDADKIPRHGKRGGECYWQEIEQLPTADVRENVRGEWINTTSGEHYKCSQCGTLAPIWIDESNSCEYYKDISEWLSDFCPNCGADMRQTLDIHFKDALDALAERRAD